MNNVKSATERMSRIPTYFESKAVLQITVRFLPFLPELWEAELPDL